MYLHDFEDGKYMVGGRTPKFYNRMEIELILKVLECSTL
jgi:hypothetical protein